VLAPQREHGAAYGAGELPRERRPRPQVRAGEAGFDDVVATLAQQFQRQVAREVVDVPDPSALREQRGFAPHACHRQIQRDVQHHAPTAGDEPRQEVVRVGHMLDHVEQQQDVERDLRLSQEVALREADPRMRAPEAGRAGRDVPAVQFGARQPRTQSRQDGAGATADLGERTGLQAVPRQKVGHQPRLPGGVLGIPGRVALGVLAVKVEACGIAADHRSVTL
jgi:hypothetical protein